MIGIAAQSETLDQAVENVWQLVALIQRATLRFHDGIVENASDFKASLKDSSVFQELVHSTGEAPKTVAMHQLSTDESPVELLQQLLLAIEGGTPASRVQHRRHRSAIDSLKESIHGYLKGFLQNRNKLHAVEVRVQRSMYDFAYGLSHEINNPLANISARASELAASASGEREKKSLRTIVDQAMKAHEMLSEMMLAVKTPMPNFAAGDVRSLILAIASTWECRAADRSIGWKNQICDDFLWAVFDREALSEAISAGIRNALEACRGGDTLTIIAERVESANGELEIRLAIVDNGPGLTPHALDHAWDLYFSGREAGRGLGIGLSKIRRIVELHQGRVWLDSKAKQGCGLEIRLPWKRVPSVA